MHARTHARTHEQRKIGTQKGDERTRVDNVCSLFQSIFSIMVHIVTAENASSAEHCGRL